MAMILESRRLQFIRYCEVNPTLGQIVRALRVLRRLVDTKASGTQEHAGGSNYGEQKTSLVSWGIPGPISSPPMF